MSLKATEWFRYQLSSVERLSVVSSQLSRNYFYVLLSSINIATELVGNTLNFIKLLAFLCSNCFQQPTFHTTECLKCFLLKVIFSNRQLITVGCGNPLMLRNPILLFSPLRLLVISLSLCVTTRQNTTLFSHSIQSVNRLSI